jgi:hypothetical protein
MNVLPFEDKLTAGVAWSWAMCLPDYPASQWQLKIYLRGVGGKLDITAAANGDEYTATQTPTQTGALAAGLYAYQFKVTSLSDSTQVFEVARGTVDVIVDLASQAQFDARTTNRQILDAIENTLKGLASRAEQEYSVQGRMLRLMSRKELEDLRARYIHLCNVEDVRSGQLGRNYNQVQARFGRTC